MLHKIKDIRVFFRFQIFYHVIGIYLFVLILLSFVGYASFTLYSLWGESRKLTTEVENYKTTIAFINNNKDLLSSGIDSYNSTLEKLIPDEETYFSVVSALEALSTKTGVEIRSYTIDLESTNLSTLSLRVEIRGSVEAIEKLLAEYQYAGGRLITIEKVEMSYTGEALNIFLFNFYHQPYTVGDTAPQDELTSKDIELIEEITTKL